MKTYILQKLLQRQNEYITGSSLSQHFGVTRSAIWKEILHLRKQGFDIEAAPRKGYRLRSIPNALHREVIQHNLTTPFWKDIIVLDDVGSTNTYLKNMDTLKEGMAVFSLRQSGGRGRQGKSWHSPDEGNIYLSVSFKPSLSMQQMSMLSLMAGLAVADAIESCCSIECAIKWPNDIVSQGEKLCGILSEITGELEGGYFCIVGIGINVNNQSFPHSIAIPATSIALQTGKPADINRLAAAVLDHLAAQYATFDSFLPRYKAKCVTLGKQVKIINADTEYTANAVDIAQEGSLIIQKDGETRVINAGEVSVRGIYGYS